MMIYLASCLFVHMSVACCLFNYDRIVLNFFSDKPMSCLNGIFDHSKHIIFCHENLEDRSIFGKS